MYTVRSRLIVRAVAVVVIVAAGVTAKIVLSHSGSASSSNPTNVSADQSLYRPANLQRAISAVEAKVGSRAGLLELSVLPGQADFTLRHGEKAFGYRWDASALSLAPLSINVVGSGSLNGQDFPLSQAQPTAMGKIAADLAHQGMTPSTMTLRRQVSNGLVGWAVTADGSGRTSVAYTADVGGNHVVNVEKAAASAASIASQTASQATSQAAQATQAGGSALKTAQKLQQCVANANGDANALALCASGQH